MVDDLDFFVSAYLPTGLTAEDTAASDAAAGDAAFSPPSSAELVEVDLPHDPHLCFICTPAGHQQPPQQPTDGKEEETQALRLRPDEEVKKEMSLLQMNDLLFIIWDYLPLSQVWRFRFLCPRWKELLQLKPGIAAELAETGEEASAGGAPLQTIPFASAADAVEVLDGMGDEMDGEEERMVAEEKEEEDEMDDDDEALTPVDRDVMEELHLEQKQILQPFMHGVVQAPVRDWKEDLQGYTEEDVAAILGARGGAEGGGGGGDERVGTWNTGVRRPREWRGRRTKTKRMRGVDRSTASAAAAASTLLPLHPDLHPGVLQRYGSLAVAALFHSPSSTFAPSHHHTPHGDALPSARPFLPSPTRALSSTSSSSSSPPSFSSSHSSLTSSSSSSSSSSPTSSASSTSLALWSSRSYLRRLVHAKLSLLPNCTPWLNPAMVASLFSVTSLHLFSFPFVRPVFACAVEGSDWTDEEARLHRREKEAYEREEKQHLQEQNDQERKQLRDSTGDKRERMLLNAAWFMRRGHREEMEDILRVMEMQGLRRRRQVQRAGGAADDAVMEELREGDEVEDGAEPPLRRHFDPRLLHLNDRERDHVMHPFWYHAGLERRAPKEVDHLSLLASLASQLTSLVFSPSTLTQTDLATLSCLHNLTSLSLHPHASEGLRPAEAIADFMSSFPHLDSLSLYSEEAVVLPAALMPHLPLLASSLRSLSIHSSWFNLEAMEAIATLTCLTSLCLSFSTEPLPLTTFDCLASLTQLSSLTLHTGTRLSYALPPALFALSSLTSLSLFGSINLHQSAFHLLPSLPLLQRLRVSDCFDSLNDVVKHVLDCPELRLIDVRGTALSWRKREQIRFERTDVQLIDS